MCRTSVCPFDSQTDLKDVWEHHQGVSRVRIWNSLDLSLRGKSFKHYGHIIETVTLDKISKEQVVT